MIKMFTPGIHAVMYEFSTTSIHIIANNAKVNFFLELSKLVYFMRTDCLPNASKASLTNVPLAGNFTGRTYFKWSLQIHLSYCSESN